MPLNAFDDRPSAPPRRDVGRPREDETVRFMRHVAPPNDSGCMIWTGSTTSGDVAMIQTVIKPDGKRGSMSCRQYLWWKLHGVPAPCGLTSTCKNPRCMTPGHLRLVSDPNVRQEVDRARQSWEHVTGSREALEAFFAYEGPNLFRAQHFGLTVKQVEILRGVKGLDLLAQMRAHGGLTQPE